MHLNKFSRLIVLLMALCMMISLFAACSQEETIDPPAQAIVPEPVDPAPVSSVECTKEISVNLYVALSPRNCRRKFEI